MGKKTTPISVRLDKDEINRLRNNSKNLKMTDSEYIRSLINNSLPPANDHRQEICTTLCKIYCLLCEQGLETEQVTKEVHRLCQILS